MPTGSTPQQPPAAPPEGSNEHSLELTPSRALPAADGSAAAPAPAPLERNTSGALAGARVEAKRALDAIYLRLEKSGIDFFQSAMHTGYGWLLKWLSWTFFRHAHVDPTQVAKIKDAASKGEVVYVMKHRSMLDYLYFNWLYLKEGLPLAQFANEVNLWLWVPIFRGIATWMAKGIWFLRHGFLPDPVDSGWVEQMITTDRPLMLFLKRRRSTVDALRRFRPRRDVAEALIAGARLATRPVYVIPQVVMWERRPETGRKTPIDVVFGEADKPHPFRKLWQFLNHYHDGVVSFGEPLELKQFLADLGPASEEVVVKKVRWMLLQHLFRERKVVTGPRLMPPTQMARRILGDPEVRAEVERVATREGKPVEAIRRRVEKMVLKMAADLRWNWLMAAERVLRWVWNNIYSGMEVDAEGVRALKNVGKDNPIVLVPSHKSHADYLILSYALYHQDMNVPLIAAGDNLAFWPMGYIFRRAGAFFIRRTMKGDALYALVLERYLRNLLKQGQLIEFFIEGGRSRTGRVLRPKLGLLTMMVRAWEAGASDDIWMAPISINYEKVIEEKSYIRELEGAAKQKESAAGMLGVFKVLTKRYGRVFVEFAEPISLRVAFGCDGATFSAKPEAEKRAAIKQLGDYIAGGINSVTVVTPSPVVAAALLAHGKRGMMHSTLVETAQFLLDFLASAGVRISPALSRDPLRAVQKAIDGFVAEGVVRRGEEEGETFYVLEDDSRISLDFYKNMVLHFFAPASFACAELAVESPLDRNALFKAYREIRDHLRLEFPDVEADVQEVEFELALHSLERAGVIQSATFSPVVVAPNGRRKLRQLASLSQAFFEAYYAAARGVAGMTEPLPEKDLQKRVGSAAAKMYRNGVLERKESLARPVLANGIKQLSTAGALTRVGNAGGEAAVEAKRRAEEAFWARYLRL
ncbi:MAG TPA: 1-acyl-sn-glycerol-3-phosphate acyltransferase [bacterium]|nr:1-acyl-sn-glycerol-3-phosphate acyltransferase [bacterium]